MCESNQMFKRALLSAPPETGVKKVGKGLCSSECDGRSTIYMP